MAFSGNPTNAMSGKLAVPLFTTGTICRAVYFTGVSSGSF